MALQIQKNGETITLRNLQEQVQKNKEDIANHYAIDRTLANLGIAVVGQVETADQLPDPATYTGNYGDAYAVGSEQDVTEGISGFEFYIYTRPDLNAGHPENYWLNVGKISIIGPQGPEGPQGIDGKDGKSSTWYTAGSAPTGANYNLGDMWLVTSGQSKGQVYYYNGTQWIGVTNIMGPQGSQGQQGAQGPQGPQGIQGPKGDTGDVGGFINVWGILENTGQLPTPASLNNLTVAYLVGSSSPYDLYIQVGETSDTALWRNTGPFNIGTLVRVNGLAQNVLDLDQYVASYVSVNVYSKNEVDKKLSSKANSSDVYTKTQVDNKLSSKANSNDVYTKSETDTKLSTKADKSDTYTKQEADGKFALTSDIPQVNNPTITFTQGGVSKGAITLNQSTDQTIELDAGGISAVKLADIVDSRGNNRFINNYGIWAAVSGMEGNGAFWALNGYNLMFEALGSFSMEVSSGSKIVSFKLPKWILNKITAPFEDVVDFISFKVVGASGAYVDKPLTVNKTTDDKIVFRTADTITTTEPKVFRIRYNLIINDL